jgi:hypothetical protein
MRSEIQREKFGTFRRNVPTILPTRSEIAFHQVRATCLAGIHFDPPKVRDCRAQRGG